MLVLFPSPALTGHAIQILHWEDNMVSAPPSLDAHEAILYAARFYFFVFQNERMSLYGSPFQRTKLMFFQQVYTVGDAGVAGDSLSPPRFNSPRGLIYFEGRLFVSDYGNGKVKQIEGTGDGYFGNVSTILTKTDSYGDPVIHEYALAPGRVEATSSGTYRSIFIADL